MPRFQHLLRWLLKHVRLEQPVPATEGVPSSWKLSCHKAGYKVSRILHSFFPCQLRNREKCNRGRIAYLQPLLLRFQYLWLPLPWSRLLWSLFPWLRQSMLRYCHHRWQRYGQLDGFCHSFHQQLLFVSPNFSLLQQQPCRYLSSNPSGSLRQSRFSIPRWW